MINQTLIIDVLASISFSIIRFASICKATYSVVCRNRFWTELYLRNCARKHVPNLPEALRQDVILNKTKGFR